MNIFFGHTGVIGHNATLDRDIYLPEQVVIGEGPKLKNTLPLFIGLAALTYILFFRK